MRRQPTRIARLLLALGITAALALGLAASTVAAPAEPAAEGAKPAKKTSAPADSESTPLNLPSSDSDAPEEGEGSDEAADEKDSTGGAITRMLFGLVVVVGAILLVQKLLRKGRGGVLGGRSTDGLVEVLTTTVLAPNRSLHLVRIGREVILVGATEQSVNHLQTLDRDNVPYLNHVTAGSEFEQALTQAVERGGTSVTTSEGFMQRFVRNLQEITAR